VDPSDDQQVDVVDASRKRVKSTFLRASALVWSSDIASARARRSALLLIDNGDNGVGEIALAVMVCSLCAGRADGADFTREGDVIVNVHGEEDFRTVAAISADGNDKDIETKAKQDALDLQLLPFMLGRV